MTSKIGVFSQSDLTALTNPKNCRIRTLSGFKEKHIGPASIDLTVNGTDMYKVEKLFRPRSQENECVYDTLEMMKAVNVQLGQEMFPGYEYVAKASVSVNFSPGLYAYANAKSTSGRNFFLVRTIADGFGWFDTIDKRNEGYTGDIWIVMQPLVYPVILTQDECFNQLRVFNGDTRFNEQDLKETLESCDLLYRRDKSPYPQGKLRLFSGDGSVFCTLYAEGKKLVGYKAEKTRRAIDFSLKNLDPREYFSPVYAEEAVRGNPDSGFIRLQAGEHYLLSTNEMIKIPENLCAELRALDPRMGLFFSHFAGFFDPGFFGTATLEVLAPYDMVLRHKDPVARFVFEKMRSDTVSYAEKGNYGGQIETQLPKQFNPWSG
ncbi:2'-deoxycytidine 5'-triphosphate deaminase [Candidatus Gracilibacteria bacterium]|nr:2'-deoxycytidine 5'-triphosphate deaminase [Candidatus Gracilibacteria bacterium]